MPSQAPPQFRAAVDLTRVDVTVLDKRTRLPIRGLTADDFVVKLSGQPREIASFAEVDAPSATRSTDAAEWRDEAALDVASNTESPGRLFVIVMDDTFPDHPRAGHLDPFYFVEGRRIAHTIVAALDPTDQAAIVFARDNRHAVDFTRDRAALRRAIDTYSPQHLDRKQALVMSLGALQRVRTFLTSMAGHRRAISWITFGPLVDVERDDLSLSCIRLQHRRTRGSKTT